MKRKSRSRRSHPETQYGPETLLIVVGYSSDARKQANVISSLKPKLQADLDRLRGVNPNIPFKVIEIWRWETHAAATVGGQEVVVTPYMLRANAVVFVFNERIGEVTWKELMLIRRRRPPIPVLPFFPGKPPAEERMLDLEVARDWYELLSKKHVLSKGWTDPDSKAITPLPTYVDPGALRKLALERLYSELLRILRPYAAHRRDRKRRTARPPSL